VEYPSISCSELSSETSVDNYFTGQYIPEDNSEHHTRRRENLKSHTVYICLSVANLVVFLQLPYIVAKITLATMTSDNIVSRDVKTTFKFQCTPKNTPFSLVTVLYIQAVRIFYKQRKLSLSK
jgi:hypothetical protein